MKSTRPDYSTPSRKGKHINAIERQQRTRSKKCNMRDFSTLETLAAGILLRVSCIFVAHGVKTEPQAKDSLEVEPLDCRMRVMVLRVVFCAFC